MIYLTVDTRTLRRRLKTRTTNDFGKTAQERAAVLGWNRFREDAFRDRGALVVEATRPIGDVVDDVLAAAGLPIG